MVQGRVEQGQEQAEAGELADLKEVK